jgi:hypothetical protein
MSMEERLLEVLRNARLWNEHGNEFVPTLGCSKCGNGCMPLCGLGMNPHVSPLETKDLTVKTRKTMLEVGKAVLPTPIQIITSTAIVIQFEAAMECVEDRVSPEDGINRLLFYRPIPTVSGLLCKDCCVCQVCFWNSGVQPSNHSQTYIMNANHINHINTKREHTDAGFLIIKYAINRFMQRGITTRFYTRRCA